MIRVCRRNLRNCSLDTPNNVEVFVTDTAAKREINNMASSKIGQVSNFPNLSYGLSSNTIINARTRALQRVNERKNKIQCC
jgi:hypothetical protein